MRPRVVGSVIMIAAGLFCGFEILHDDGIVGQTKKPLLAPVLAAKGCFCHGDSASPITRVWISGPESLAAGMHALYKINVAKDSSIAAGFDVAAFFGDLGVYDSLDTQLMRVDPNNPIDSLELTHTDPKLASGHDTVSWTFRYSAPMTSGVIDTIYACGNSVDLSLDPNDDYWNYAPNFLVHIVSSTAVKEGSIVQSFRLAQNYPNPFNPSTVIHFEMPVPGRSSLIVYDMEGKEVEELLNDALGAGAHEVVFVADKEKGISSGVYFYRLVVQPSAGEPIVATRKMLLVK